jgi:hypothetical protein
MARVLPKLLSNTSRSNTNIHEQHGKLIRKWLLSLTESFSIYHKNRTLILSGAAGCGKHELFLNIVSQVNRNIVSDSKDNHNDQIHIRKLSIDMYHSSTLSSASSMSSTPSSTSSKRLKTSTRLSNSHDGVDNDNDNDNDADYERSSPVIGSNVVKLGSSKNREKVKNWLLETLGFSDSKQMDVIKQLHRSLEMDKLQKRILEEEMLKQEERKAFLSMPSTHHMMLLGRQPQANKTVVVKPKTTVESAKQKSIKPIHLSKTKNNVTHRINSINSLHEMKIQEIKHDHDRSCQQTTQTCTIWIIDVLDNNHDFVKLVYHLMRERSNSLLELADENKVGEKVRSASELLLGRTGMVIVCKNLDWLTSTSQRITYKENWCTIIQLKGVSPEEMKVILHNHVISRTGYTNEFIRENNRKFRFDSIIEAANGDLRTALLLIQFVINSITRQFNMMMMVSDTSASTLTSTSTPTTVAVSTRSQLMVSADDTLFYKNHFDPFAQSLLINLSIWEDGLDMEALQNLFNWMYNTARLSVNVKATDIVSCLFNLNKTLSKKQKSKKYTSTPHIEGQYLALFLQMLQQSRYGYRFKPRKSHEIQRLLLMRQSGYYRIIPLTTNNSNSHREIRELVSHVLGISIHWGLQHSKPEKQYFFKFHDRKNNKRSNSTTSTPKLHGMTTSASSSWSIEHLTNDRFGALIKRIVACEESIVFKLINEFLICTLQHVTYLNKNVTTTDNKNDNDDDDHEDDDCEVEDTNVGTKILFGQHEALEYMSRRALDLANSDSYYSVSQTKISSAYSSHYSVIHHNAFRTARICRGLKSMIYDKARGLVLPLHDRCSDECRHRDGLLNRVNTDVQTLSSPSSSSSSSTSTSTSTSQSIFRFTPSEVYKHDQQLSRGGREMIDRKATLKILQRVGALQTIEELTDRRVITRKIQDQVYSLTAISSKLKSDFSTLTTTEAQCVAVPVNSKQRRLFNSYHDCEIQAGVPCGKNKINPSEFIEVIRSVPTTYESSTILHESVPTTSLIDNSGVADDDLLALI